MAGTAAMAAQPIVLPPEVLVLVLEHVPLDSRLRSCALVQRGWHKAAVAATKVISITLKNSEQWDSLQDWLIQHGSDVTSLCVFTSADNDCSYCHRMYIRELPCPKLQRLELQCSILGPAVDKHALALHLEPGAHSAPGGLFSHCSSTLRELVLRCDVSGGHSPWLCWLTFSPLHTLN